MRYIFLTVILICSAVTAVGQILAWKKPDPSAVPYSALLKRAVVNIQDQCKRGDTTIAEAGTGFFVAYEDPRLPQGQSFTYLITNRHVAQCWDDDHHPLEIQTQLIRANNKNGEGVLLSLNPSMWTFPLDESVDLAAMPIASFANLDIVDIPISQFATKAFMHDNVITEGNSVILTGYFYQFSGSQKFQPIVRQGIISMIPDEPVTTTTGKPGSVYLCDAHIFGGNSGSPVMVASDPLNMGGYHLLGVVSGYYFEDENFNLEIATTIKGTAKANSGIAMVVPADFIKTLLDEPQLKGPREIFIMQHPKLEAPALDHKN